MCVWTAGLANSATSSAVQAHLEPSAQTFVGAVQTVVKRAALPTACAQAGVLRIPPERTAEQSAHRAQAPLAFTAKDRTPVPAAARNVPRRLPGRLVWRRVPTRVSARNIRSELLSRLWSLPQNKAWRAGAVCDAEAGRCADAGVCEEGWTGVRCDKACPPGSYGRRCSSVCGACANGSTCSSVSGECPAGCRKLRSGTACQTPCAACASPSCYGCKGSFGQCLTPKGICLQGCTAGWAGAECRYRCPAGTHGANCTRDCGHCLDNSTQEPTTCDAVTGECPLAYVCLDGWTGKQCDKQCGAGTFGAKCANVCGSCANGNETCSAADGLCTSGCAAHSTGEDCRTECASCSSASCVHCKGSHGQCLLPQGTCLDGCQAGWFGEECRLGCPPGTYGVNCSRDCGRCLKTRRGGQVQYVTQKPDGVQTLACAKRLDGS
ncbi:hypothetical protein C0Q70_16814 [Pomacea canaliculata]|uniref:EGF-like domain-containing protein n=1 Tax=Pomacea canaliculata TaxID=400727 RepID=A0A2T7NQW5_POMCA|nr:hypothetical protein C0Q70_16814 [Pomacea canaliculata]